MLPRSTSLGLSKLYSLSWYTLRRLSDQQIVILKKTGASLKVDRKPSRPPFMKNVFLGEFDKEMLIYPELDKASLQELKNKTKPLKDFFEASVDPTVTSSLNMVPNEIKESLKDLGLFGQLIPAAYGGSDLTATETAFVSEIVAKDLNIALSLYSHNFHAAQSLVLYGSPQQKEKYLYRLASGEWLAGLCMSESSTGSDLASISTTLKPSEENPELNLLNGKKQWVVNGLNANLFVVVAKLDHTTHFGKILPAVRLVLVERDAPGVTVSKPIEHLGLNASGVCHVEFKDTPIYPESFLGDTETKGFEMCINILNSGRFNIGATAVSVLKTLLEESSEFILRRKQYERPLYECENVQEKFADVAMCIYALESMTYHTAGLLDMYDNQDCALELAIIKIFSFTEGRRCLDLIMELMGGRAYMKSEIVQNYFRDFRTMEVFDGATDVASLFVTLMGLQHAGMTMRETVSKMRFPYEYPAFVLKNMFSNRRQSKDKPKLTLRLFEQLHPTLTDSANDLEYCVLRLNYAISVLFNLYGSDIIKQQVDLKRLSDVAVKIYAMTAVLSRSSRSYCIGLRNADEELKYAIMICKKYKEMCSSKLNVIINGVVLSGDTQVLKFGPDILEHHGYFLEHATERSY